ncbi:UNKNOWN [Stylonychia lemnae]|uniref:Uncharacterized protein n=1 Tax=Stylonychia lemnae TaxID=5949 RepID=A0A078AIX3_STYLE|nr:UNKNOWN [Stylonychia lemnae]|eukprot:CDW82270.1 UNKNOWN [Stylonychia lemnae]
MSDIQKLNENETEEEELKRQEEEEDKKDNDEMFNKIFNSIKTDMKESIKKKIELPFKIFIYSLAGLLLGLKMIGGYSPTESIWLLLDITYYMFYYTISIIAFAWPIAIILMLKSNPNSEKLKLYIILVVNTLLNYIFPQFRYITTTFVLGMCYVAFIFSCLIASFLIFCGYAIIKDIMRQICKKDKRKREGQENNKTD